VRDEAERRARISAGHLLPINDGASQRILYPPMQFRDMLGHVTVVVQLPAGTSTLTLAKQSRYSW
jgi:hypothetical protein